MATLVCMNCPCSSKAGDNQNTVEVDAIELDSALNGGSNQRPKVSLEPEGDGAVQVVSGTERVLLNIRDLLATVVRTKYRHRRQKEHTERAMNDWVFAATVFDRICFILIALCFVGGTLVLMLLPIFASN